LTFLSLLTLVPYIFATKTAPSLSITGPLALELDIVDGALDQKVEMNGDVAEQGHQEQ